MVDGVHYALGVGHAGKTWYLSRAASIGNPMRTSCPYSARTWPTVEELGLWVDALPEGAREQLAGRTLLILPVLVVVDRPVKTLTLKFAEPAREHAAP